VRSGRDPGTTRAAERTKSLEHGPTWAPDPQARRAVRSLFAVVEQYPQLKSGANVLSLQAEIQRIETLIADRRELYNDQVYRHNTRIAQVPAALIAGLFGWRPREFFTVIEDERLRPDATLRPV
jgi:LemA protein